MIRFPVLILAGILSAPLMDLGSVAWMRILPAGFDLTANYFLMVVLPVALVLHFAVALLLWKAFEPSPGVSGIVYVGTHLTAQAVMLTLFLNPIHDILIYLLVILASGTVVLFVFNRYFWCPTCAAVPRAKPGG